MKISASKLGRRIVSMLLVVCMLIPMIPQVGAEATSIDVDITVDGEIKSYAKLDVDSSLTLSAYTPVEDDYEYQWQIYVGDMWVDISEQTGADLNVTMAMIENALVFGYAHIRLAVKNDEGMTGFSDEIMVSTYTSEKEAEQSEKSPLKASAPLKAATSIYTIKIEYRIYNEDETQQYLIYQPYTAQITAGQPFHTNEKNPDIIGYEAMVYNETTGKYEPSESIEISIESVTKSQTYVVYYFPKEVLYSVKFMVQNLYDDGYSHAKTVQYLGLTGSDTDNEKAISDYLKSIGAEDGLYAVYNEPLVIAADGSTEVTIYLDRRYFYVSFDLGENGYGTRAVYAKYGSEITIYESNASRSGYVLSGWTVDPATVPFTFSTTTKNLVFKVPAMTTKFTAKWDRGNTTYHVVYWLENPDDSNFSYLADKEVSAQSGAVVSGSDDYDDSKGANLKQYYYEYNKYKTDKNITVEGDGSTIVNVYYNRRMFEIWFGVKNSVSANSENYIVSKLPAHTHTDACKEYLCGGSAGTSSSLICGKSEHTHGASCCTIPEHTHNAFCKSYSFRITRNTTNYLNVSNVVFNEADGLTTVNNAVAIANNVYRVNGTGNNRTYYYRLEGKYYLIGTSATGSNNPNGATVTPSTGNVCGITAHTHGTNCCTLTEHTHGAFCYTYTITVRRSNYQQIFSGTYTFSESSGVTTTMTGEVGNNVYYVRSGNNYSYRYAYYYKIGDLYYQIVTNQQNAPSSATVTQTLSCGRTEHTHGTGCVPCTKEEHTHTEECYAGIGETTSEHVHTADCPTRYNCGYASGYSSSDNVVYSIRAKYQQNIADVWPSANIVVPNAVSNMSCWIYDMNNIEAADINRSKCDNYQYTRMVTMEGALCNTATGVRKMYLRVATDYNWRAYYMFDELMFEGKTLPQIAAGLGRTFSYAAEGSTVSRKNTNAGTANYIDYYTPELKNGYDEQYCKTYIYGAKDISNVTAKKVNGRNPDNWTQYNTDAEVVSDNPNGDHKASGATYLYYNRDRYSLSLFNYNTVEAETVIDNVQFGLPYWAVSVNGTPLENYVPPYPKNIEAGAYKFDGWYTTPLCFPGTEVDFENGFVSGPTQFYAKYVPVTHHVTFWLDSTMSEVVTKSNCYNFVGVDSGELEFQFTNKSDYENFYVDHGANLSTILPASVRRNDSDQHYLAGWFYMKDGVKTAYYPTMPVTSDMDLFAEWESTLVVSYEVRYKLIEIQDKKRVYTDTEIAYPTTGSTLAGRSKVFYAKTNVNWYDEYKPVWLFPEVNIHTINMVPDESSNTFTFYYVGADYAIPYVINYVDASTGEPVAAPYSGSVNQNLARTDMNAPIIYPVYEDVEGYIPDAYEKELIIVCTGDPEEDIKQNVVTFYYTKTEDTTQAVYDVVYKYETTEAGVYEQISSEYFQDEAGADLKEKLSTYLTTGKFGREEAFNVDGVKIILSYLDSKGERITTEPMAPSEITELKLPEHGMQITLMYDRNRFDYDVKHVRADDLTKYILDEEVSHITGTALYGQKLTLEALEGAAEIGYTVVGEAHRTPTITSASNFTFTYTAGSAEIIYARVGYDPQTGKYVVYSDDDPFDGGSVTPGVQFVDLPTGHVQGTTDAPSATASAEGSYRFIGWYAIESDEAGALDYEGRTLVTEDATISPVPDDTIYADVTYYALFEYVVGVTDLTISRAGGEGESFVYHITGTGLDLYVVVPGGSAVTVKDLAVGEEYTITEMGNWSWTFELAEVSPMTLDVDASNNLAAFVSDAKELTNNWLNNSDEASNVFKKDN